MTTTEFATDEGLPVLLPSGAEWVVLNTDEKRYLEERVVRYLSDNHFVNVSDFQDVDRMLQMELLVFRWTHWVSRQRDYFGDQIDEAALRRSVNDYSQELRQLKKILGIDKATRDRQKGDDSVPVYLDNLGERAREFGVMREEQSAKSIELAMQVMALLQLHDNSDDQERREMHVTTDDVMEWLRTVYTPEMKAIDEHFRTHIQRYWIRQQ